MSCVFVCFDVVVVFNNFDVCLLCITIRYVVFILYVSIL